jgi:hypothetical protein
LLPLKSFCCREKAYGYAKVIHKKRVNKIDKCPRYLKQYNGYSYACLRKKEKEEMNKIVHVFLQKYFQVSKERYVFKEHSRIRLATIYIHHIHPHTCTS